ncbi:MAG: glutaredoxin [Kofleriaceae bacterium]|nr:glutaredoxin [Kofleriaceae bacterium]
MSSLSLYYYPSCGFCGMVRQAAERAGVEMELRDIHTDQQHMKDLLDARGRRTVPVLRIDKGDGDVQWMPESREIMAYLQTL